VSAQSAAAHAAQAAIDWRDNPNDDAAHANAETALANARTQGATPAQLEAAAIAARR
jgi:hypothetical protein